MLAACTAAPPTATPTPVVLVVTATPAPKPAAAPAAAQAPATPAPPALKPAAEAKPTAPPAAKPAAKVAATPTSAAAEQRLAVGRTNSYRGLEFTIEEARLGERIESEQARRGNVLVGLRLRVHNPTQQRIAFTGTALTMLMRLQLPDGANPTARAEQPFIRPSVPPGESLAGWAYFELDRPAPLESLKLALGGGDETQAIIPLSGPEQVVAPRSFEYLRSTEPVRGLLWSVSGGTLRLDLPGQQANPGQEFLVLKVRATNPSPSRVELLHANRQRQQAIDYLRVEADNGVLLQQSAELNALPWDFPPKAEQDALYAWQLPHGSKNPKLVILSPDNSQHRLELGPLPPP